MKRHGYAGQHWAGLPARARVLPALLADDAAMLASLVDEADVQAIHCALWTAAGSAPGTRCLEWLLGRGASPESPHWQDRGSNEPVAQIPMLCDPDSDAGRISLAKLEWFGRRGCDLLPALWTAMFPWHESEERTVRWTNLVLDSSGRRETWLHCGDCFEAAHCGRHVALLLELGFHPEARTRWGDYPIHRPLDEDFHVDPVATLELLVKHGASLNRPNQQGQSILHLSIRHKKRDVFDWIIAQKEFNVRARDVNGLSAEDILPRRSEARSEVFRQEWLPALRLRLKADRKAGSPAP